MYVQHNSEALSDLCSLSFPRSLFTPNYNNSAWLFWRKIVFQAIYKHVYPYIVAISIYKIETVQRNKRHFLVNGLCIRTGQLDPLWWRLIRCIFSRFPDPGLQTRLYVCLFALNVRLANRFCMAPCYVWTFICFLGPLGCAVFLVITARFSKKYDIKCTFWYLCNLFLKLVYPKKNSSRVS